jgi:hypothetical protein
MIRAWATGLVALKFVPVSQTLARFTISGVQGATVRLLGKFAGAPLRFAADLTVLLKGRTEAWLDTEADGQPQALRAEQPLLASSPLGCVRARSAEFIFIKAS